MLSITKPFWVISLLLCVAVNVLTYAHHPDRVNLLYDQPITNSYYVGKESVFYLNFAVMLFVNVVLNMAGRVVAMLPRNLVVVPYKARWFQSVNTRKEFYKNAKEWTRGVAFLVNLFLATAMTIVYSNNSTSNFNLKWVLYLILFMSLAWAVYFLILFLSKPKTYQTSP
jgi:hypothetical protein